MQDLVPLWFMQLYGFVWLGVARFAVEAWRVSRRDRERKEVLLRLRRWRDC